MLWEKSFEAGELLDQHLHRASESRLTAEQIRSLRRPSEKLALPTVTLCAVSSVNLDATLAALGASLDQIEFAQCLLFTDTAPVAIDPRVQVVEIPRIHSACDYSKFMLDELAAHLKTDHCLTVQWDGFILDARQWKPEFLDYDYIGAPWPKFGTGEDVGNGGFSLRSRRLVEACRDPDFVRGAAEDVAICRVNRSFLERDFGLRFADRKIAEHFAFERNIPTNKTFGFHGIFNMVQALGVDRFWEIYSTLDDRRTAFVDYWLLLRQLGSGRDALRRRFRLTTDLLKSLGALRRSVLTEFRGA
jgi:hypothetical protein